MGRVLGLDAMTLNPRRVHRRSITDRLLIDGLRTIGLIFIYYSFSIGITFYQKWFIKGFHYPLVVVTCHLAVKFLISGFLRLAYRYWTGIARISLPMSQWVQRVAVVGLASSLDVGLSNWSFEFITISLYTMTKSTCILFILGFAILFNLERKRASLIVIVILISAGLFMFTYHSTQFNSTGFFLVLSASFAAGLRWTLAQIVMQRKDAGLGHPVDMIYHVQPWMILGLLPLVLIFEVIPVMRSGPLADRFADHDLFTHTVYYILIGSVLAFLMECSEYLLLTYTSSLTLSIAGIIKEVFTLGLAFEVNGDQMSFLNFIGLIVCLTGIALHVLLKAIDTTLHAPKSPSPNASKVSHDRITSGNRRPPGEASSSFGDLFANYGSDWDQPEGSGGTHEDEYELLLNGDRDSDAIGLHSTSRGRDPIMDVELDTLATSSTQAIILPKATSSRRASNSQSTPVVSSDQASGNSQPDCAVINHSEINLTSPIGLNQTQLNRPKTTSASNKRSTSRKP